MQNLGKILTTLAICFTLLVPASALALSPFLSFGGRIVSLPIACMSPLGPAFWIAVVPFGLPGTIPLNFIVTLPTLGSTVPPVPTLPPTNPGQQILGTYIPVPSACSTFAGGFPLFGFQVLTQNTSIVF